MKIRLYGKVNDSIVDGPGLRYAIFTQGCPHHCVGCHNPLSHPIEGGTIEDTDDLMKEIIKNPLLDGVTISGGEPFLQCEPLIDLITQLKEKDLHVMIYSGYTYEEIIQLGPRQRKLLSLCDILVDGRFEKSLKSLSLLYCGSTNQRIINVPLSIKEQRIIEQNFNKYGEFVF